MSTLKLARYAGLVAALVITGCGGGGGDDPVWADKGVASCIEALGRLANVPASTLGLPDGGNGVATRDYGPTAGGVTRQIDFSNGPARTEAGYVSYGSCLMGPGDTVMSVAAAGKVLAGP